MISGKYKHYKGGEYEVLCVAVYTETEEDLIVYKSITDGSVWARPFSMWEEGVVVDGKTVKRFVKIK